ncbi:hypothetical protein FIBSPDRAFT_165765 [Athelia psychrophila]|uniref:Uncharacterized protein n=1 Tax=Athelia psychrophila TaxID=1759441 RepID=A0A165YCB8_9AGAM|nr:hypothetical protein FIBSPDRAFT_239459 [Fibularhizoctonia sp. CBS 109695]KZP12261.1 hypothetical protein FIBSPDRAFT_165765 [Fibularhizoctonia sp. CBS 109695]
MNGVIEGSQRGYCSRSRIAGLSSKLVLSSRPLPVQCHFLTRHYSPEILAAKIHFLDESDKVLPGNCIMATNASWYTFNAMAAHVTNRARLVSTRNYMPPSPASSAHSLNVLLFASLVPPSFSSRTSRCLPSPMLM